MNANLGTHLSPFTRLLVGSFCSLLFAAPLASAQQGGAAERDRLIQEDLNFISGLQQWGLQDYAVMAMDAFKAKYPDKILKIKTAELEGLLAVGEFKKVEAIIAREPSQTSQEAWGMKLTLADGYYAWGKYDLAQNIYEGFFKQYPDGPPAALNDFYRDSAYKYSQMLMLMGKHKEALTAYRRILKSKLERHVERQVKGEMTELMIRVAEDAKGAERTTLLTEAEKIANDLLWIQDLWFGRSIVSLAHIKMVQGDVEKAAKLVDDYMGDLKAIHDKLVEDSKQTGEDLTRLSPLAECRYLLAAMMQKEAEKLIKNNGSPDKIKELLAGKQIGGSSKRTPGAYQHYLHVFILFPNSQWAGQAGVRAREVEGILTTKFGAQIETKVSDAQMDEVRKYQFRQARNEFNQQQFEKAIESYISALTLFPEGKTSVAAVGELCQSYLELGQDLHADMVASYLAERFSGQKELISSAGDQLLKLATYCGDRKMLDKRDAYYDMYFAHYKNHPRVAGMLFVFGQEQFDRENYDGALKYFNIIADNHKASTVYNSAAMKVATCHAKMGDTTNELNTLTAIVKELETQEKPGHALINAKFRTAYAYKQLGPKYLSTAFNRYAELVKTLRESESRHANNADEKQANQRILEASLFYSGICLSQMAPPEDNVNLYRRKAVETLSDLVKTFPTSEYAPLALSQLATFHFLLEEPDAARKALDDLRKGYPNSDAAKNSSFLLADSLMKLGFRDKALGIFKEMFAGGGDYSDGQILSAGRELLKAQEYEIALQAFNRALKGTKNRGVEEPAMAGRGECLQKLGDHQGAVDQLTDLLAKYPNSGYTVESGLVLSQAYADLGMKDANADNRYGFFNNAVKSMNRARLFEKSPGGRARLDIGVARIYARKAKADQQFADAKAVEDSRGFAVATYQTLIMTADERDPEVRRHIETAYRECLPLLLEMEKWQDALNDADRFLELFPRSEWLADVRTYRTSARTKLVTSGISVPGAANEPGLGVDTNAVEAATNAVVPVVGTNTAEAATDAVDPVVGTNTPEVATNAVPPAIDAPVAE